MLTPSRLFAAWWCAIFLFVLASIFFPRVVFGIPHFELIRLLVPLALLASVAYLCWSLYRRGIKRSSPK